MVGNQQIHEQLRIIDKKILLFTGIGAILGFLFPYIFLAIRTASSGYVQSNGQFFTFANAAYIIQQSSAEEFLMRGYLLNYLRKYNFNPMVAILIQAIVFVVGHIVVYKTDYMILSVILAVGIITGYLTWKSNHLAPAFVLHSVTNLVSQSM
jgi:membrane protease YdiL (CAAX protease family)